MNDTLENWRKQIDALDRELLQILSHRMDIVKKIGAYKKKNRIPPLDEKRWKEVLDSQLSRANIFHLSKDFVLKFYNAIHEYALEIERNI